VSEEALRRLRSQLGPVTTVAASEAKNQFGQVLESALRGGAVVITKHEMPKAVLLSIEEFDAITRPRAQLDALGERLDALVAAMQKPRARAAVDKLFAAKSEELGVAAVRGARTKR